MHYPATLARLQAEIRPNFSSLESVRAGTTLSACRWLRACIEEAMRMSLGVPGLLSRELFANGVTIEGDWFGPSTDLGVAHYTVHHNEALFPDSFSYRPERYIVGCPPWSGDTASSSGLSLHDRSVTSADEVASAESGFCPFSIGQRGCVGKVVAMKGLMITIAPLVWLYNMPLAPGQEQIGGGAGWGRFGREREHEFHMRDMLVAKTERPIMQFRRF